MPDNYLQHLFSGNFQSSYQAARYADIAKLAEQQAILDHCFHYPEVPVTGLTDLLQRNAAWLGVYLYRFGRALWLKDQADPLLKEIHQLIRRHCAMEIYFSIEIGEGFEIRHGLGSVIGSRCRIGRGFVIHQGCTVGHATKYGNGPSIGDEVEMGAGSSILGEINVGNRAKIAAHTLVLHDVPEAAIIKGLH